MDHAETLSGIGGMGTICLRSGKADAKSLERARCEAMMGMACPGSAAHFRKHVVRLSMEIHGGVRACLLEAATLPFEHIGEEGLRMRSASEDRNEIGRMMVEDLRSGGDAMRITNEHADALMAFVRSLHDRIAELLAGVSSWQKGSPQDRAYHLLDIAMGTQAGICHRAREIAGVSVEEGQFGGLPPLISSDISRSVMARILRTVADDDDLLRETRQLCAKTFSKPYTIPSDARPLITETRRAQQRLSLSVRDALHHRAIREEHATIASFLEGAKDVTPGDIPRGVASVVQQYPSADTAYTAWRQGSFDMEEFEMDLRIMGSPDDCTEGSDIPRTSAQPHAMRVDGRIYVTTHAPYAGLSEDLLPAGTADMLRALFNERRSVLLRSLALAPLLEGQLPHLTEPVIFVRSPLATLLHITPQNAAIIEGCLPHRLSDQARERILQGQWTIEPLTNLDADHADDATDTLLAHDEMAKDVLTSVRKIMPLLSRRMFTFGEIESALRSIGVQMLPGRGKGSHRMMNNPVNSKKCTFSKRYAEHPRTSVPIGILAGALISMGFDDDQLNALVGILNA